MSKSIKLKNNYYMDSKSVNHNRRTLETLLNDLFYKNGDVFQVSNELDCAGMISSGRNKVYFTIPVDKNLKYINRITINSLNCEVRHATGGYMASDVELSTLGSLAIGKASNTALKVIWTLNSTSSYTNNLPVIVSIESCRITFNT